MTVTIAGDEITFDFTGTDPQARGNVNAVTAVTVSAVAFALRTAIDPTIPANGGSLRPVHVVGPGGTLVSARPPAAVGAGNVEVSQRIADVCLGALAQAAPDRVGAAGQGTMNNVLIGGEGWVYYETIAGGEGGQPHRAGMSRRPHRDDQQQEHADRGARASVPAAGPPLPAARGERRSGPASPAATASSATSRCSSPARSASSPSAAPAARPGWPAAATARRARTGSSPAASSASPSASPTSAPSSSRTATSSGCSRRAVAAGGRRRRRADGVLATPPEPQPPRSISDRGCVRLETMLLVVGAMVRRSVGGILLVAFAAALLLGGALAALVGARRSADAIDRAVAYSTPEDAFVGSVSGEPFDQAAVEALPEVQAAMYQAYVALVPLGPDGEAQLDLIGSINPYLYVPASGPAGAINRLRILEGRDLDPKAPFEVVIDEELAADRDLHVGSQLSMGTYSLDQMDSVFGSERGAAEPEPEGPPVDLEVVGITRMPVDVHPDEEEHTTSFGGTADIYLTPAFYERLGSQIISFGGPDPASPLALRLEHGVADIDAVRTAVAALPGGADLVVDVSESDAAGAVATARQAISVETAALTATAGLLALAAVLLVGQSLARLAQSAAAELVVLRALGLRRRELLIAGAAPGLVAVVAGAVLAVAVAVAASPLTPIGMARQAEISPGLHVDATVLLVGALTIVVAGAALALLAAAPAVRATAPVADAPSHRRSVADRLAGLGAPLPAVLGARFAGGADRSSTRAPLRLGHRDGGARARRAGRRRHLRSQPPPAARRARGPGRDVGPRRREHQPQRLHRRRHRPDGRRPGGRRRRRGRRGAGWRHGRRAGHDHRRVRLGER